MVARPVNSSKIKSKGNHATTHALTQAWRLRDKQRDGEKDDDARGCGNGVLYCTESSSKQPKVMVIVRGARCGVVPSITPSRLV